MSCKITLMLVSFAASVALEGLIHGVRLHVALQLTIQSANAIALVALQLLFSCMHPHHVDFQVTGCNVGILAHCAYVRLPPIRGPFVSLQVA